jgi:hypothetical protein
MFLHQLQRISKFTTSEMPELSQLQITSPLAILELGMDIPLRRLTNLTISSSRKSLAG